MTYLDDSVVDDRLPVPLFCLAVSPFWHFFVVWPSSWHSGHLFLFLAPGSSDALILVFLGLPGFLLNLAFLILYQDQHVARKCFDVIGLNTPEYAFLSLSTEK